MTTLAQLSTAAQAALQDADAHHAKVAAHFLRTQLPELFRAARTSHPPTKPNPTPPPSRGI